MFYQTGTRSICTRQTGGNGSRIFVRWMKWKTCWTRRNSYRAEPAVYVQKGFLRATAQMIREIKSAAEDGKTLPVMVSKDKAAAFKEWITP